MRGSKFFDIRAIGYCLAVLYSVSLVFCLNSLSSTTIVEIQTRYSIITIFLGILLVGAIAVIQLKEWGRHVLITASTLMGVYLLKAYVKDIVPAAFIFMNIIIILFFSQYNIEIYFRHLKVKKNKGTWQSILVVDNDEAFLKTIRPILTTHGFAALTASSGEEGVGIAKTQKPDLIILDVILPGLKGRDVCKQLKADPATRDIPIIFITVKNSKDDIEAEMRAGAEAHLTKPVQITHLIKTVQGILESHASKPVS